MSELRFGIIVAFVWFTGFMTGALFGGNNAWSAWAVITLIGFAVGVAAARIRRGFL